MRIALCVGLAVMLARGHQAPAGASDVAKTREGSLVTVGDYRLYVEKVPQPLGSRPLVVLGGGKRPPPPPGITADTWASLRAEREAQVRELAALSRNSRFVQDAASGHSLHRDNPGLVVQPIQHVVRAAANGRRLTP